MTKKRNRFKNLNNITPEDFQDAANEGSESFIPIWEAASIINQIKDNNRLISDWGSACNFLLKKIGKKGFKLVEIMYMSHWLVNNAEAPGWPTDEHIKQLQDSNGVKS